MSRFQITSNPANYKMDQLVQDGKREFYWAKSSFPQYAKPKVGDKVYIIINTHKEDTALKYVARIDAEDTACKSMADFEALSDYAYYKNKPKKDIADCLKKKGKYDCFKLVMETSVDDPKLRKDILFQKGLPIDKKGNLQVKGCNDQDPKRSELMVFFDYVENVIEKSIHAIDLSEANISQVSKAQRVTNVMFDKIESALKNKQQIVLTGAPGTGKTYSVREYVKSDTNSADQYEFVQFHPSYDYSDFVEGLRPVTIKNNISFARIDGTFKAFCRKVVEANLRYACPELGEEERKDKLNTFYKQLTESQVALSDDAAEELDNFEKGENNFYFIIDEINRADLSKVFGELMFALEESYRGIENRFRTQYSNLRMYEIDQNSGMAQPMKFDCFEDGFFIPHNVVIIGTMNDIDKSVEAFDFALRRRFEWVDIKANEVMEDGLKGSVDDNILAGDADKLKSLANRIIKMNEYISRSSGGGRFGLSEAYHIGHAFFKNVMIDKEGNYDNSLREVFDANITSIIREYLRGRRQLDVNDVITNCRNALEL